MLSPYEALDATALPARAHPSSLLKFAFELLFAIVLSLTNGAPSLVAQEIESDDVFRVRTDLVTVPLIVTDSRGRRVVGLTETDFVLQAEGQAQKIAFFAIGTSRVALPFLIDSSGSAREYLSDEREAALSLLSRFGSQSEVSVLQFSDRPRIVVPFSVNMGEARKGFDFPSLSGRRTAIFDAAMAALELMDQRKVDPTERRIVILTSDGLDNVSTVKASRVIEHARRNSVAFYVIHFPVFTPQGDRLAPRRAASGFRDLAEKTGGQYFVVGDAQSSLATHRKHDLSQVFRTIEQDLAAQYLLGFYPDEVSRDGRRLEVSFSRKVHGYRINTLRRAYRLDPSVKEPSR